MAKRQRIRLTEHLPSTAFSGTYGSNKEKTLLEGSGLAVMFNEDGSVVIEVFDRHKRVGLRISPEDAKQHAPDFRRWSVIR
jgi:hypothetical protein